MELNWVDIDIELDGAFLIRSGGYRVVCQNWKYISGESIWEICSSTENYKRMGGGRVGEAWMKIFLFWVLLKNCYNIIYGKKLKNNK